MKKPMHLTDQQLALVSTDFDLRISHLASFIYSLLPLKQGKLIDIGAGNGLILKYFKDKGYDVAGIELEEQQVHQMRGDLKLKGVKLEQGDITKLKGREDYDVVIASDVIEHIEDDGHALTNLWSFVKPNGYLVLTVPAHTYLYGVRDKRWGHFRRYDRAYMLQKISQLSHSSVTTITHWNTVGYITYFIYERILGKPINESLRYEKSLLSQIVHFAIQITFFIEKLLGGTMFGLTLVVIVKKQET